MDHYEAVEIVKLIIVVVSEQFLHDIVPEFIEGDVLYFCEYFIQENVSIENVATYEAHKGFY
jgi:hypothetical protein